MSILEILKGDHERFRRILTDLERGALDTGESFTSRSWEEGSLKATIKIAQDLVGEMAEHELIERKVLFPALRRKLPATVKILEKLEKEHTVLDRMFEEFLRELMPPGDRTTGWMIMHLGRMAKMLKWHMQREEQEIFPILNEKFTQEEIENIEKDADAVRVKA